METTFGARMRDHREQQGIALTAIAEQTKIKRSLLDGLERDDLSHWPSGIFRRAWVRSYAAAIGLDPDQTVREFLEAHPDPVEIARQALPPPAAPQPWYRRAVVFLRPARGRTFEEPEDATPEAVPAPDVDLAALARVCTELGRVASAKDVQPLLAEAAGILGARGLIVWVWDHRSEALRAAFVQGYSPAIVAKLPPVTRDSDNPTAEAFRSAQPRESGGHGNGALVVPLLIPRCAGVLAVEFQEGRAVTASLRATAAILAAAIAQLVARARATQVQARLASKPRPPRPVTTFVTPAVQ